jgi:hypothetical protein
MKKRNALTLSVTMLILLARGETGLAVLPEDSDSERPGRSGRSISSRRPQDCVTC